MKIRVSFCFIVVDALKWYMELEGVKVLSKTPVHFNNERYIVIVFLLLTNKYNKQK